MSQGRKKAQHTEAHTRHVGPDHSQTSGKTAACNGGKGSDPGGQNAEASQEL